MIVNDLTKMLLSNKFKEFVELIRISKIETNDKTDNNETSNSKFNDNKTSDDKNDENFVTNYYGKANKKVSFETEKAK